MVWVPDQFSTIIMALVNGVLCVCVSLQTILQCLDRHFTHMRNEKLNIIQTLPQRFLTRSAGDEFEYNLHLFLSFDITQTVHYIFFS